MQDQAQAQASPPPKQGLEQGRLTTHVLDTSRGCPAANMRIELFRHQLEEGAQKGVQKGVFVSLLSRRTNSDGRCDAPLLAGAALEIGTYRLCFEVGAYYAAQGTLFQVPPFLDLVEIRFLVGDAEAHYHVPLLISPFGYSSYRGS